MNIRLTHIDGKLPNLALMKLSHYYKSQGHNVYFTRKIIKSNDESQYDLVYGSCIFTFSNTLLSKFLVSFPDAIVGGTGTDDLSLTVEQQIGLSEYENYDYSIYPDYEFSLGFTSRGCRLNCPFCVVPKKEGKPRAINSVYDIWRKDKEKKVILLDNGFFGQQHDLFLDRIHEIYYGDFKVSFNQGINIRLINDETAYWIGQIKYYDDQFTVRRIYTAWDRLRDEKIFIDGIKLLTKKKNRVKPYHIMVYMLIGFEKNETMDEIFYRYNRIMEFGLKPYPMVYDKTKKHLIRFQRWVVRRYHEFISWDDFLKSYKSPTFEEENA